ncbi:hypothetical protein M3Y99_00974400 [Aphelenchoides fujianensis]|nr:hypothetical protein M3Y99_00974400 [Aphelenchoides fujianensis]
MDCRPQTFDPLTLLLAAGDESAWKEQVAAGFVHLLGVVEELREECAGLRRLLGVGTSTQYTPESAEKLGFEAARVRPHPMRGFDPLRPQRVRAIGAIVADFAHGHALNGCSLREVVQPITTGVIRKLFDADAAKLTYTEDSVGKGRPARYARVPCEFVRELSEAIVDGFDATRAQRAQLLPQARLMAGTVARNYFNNARSHRKKAPRSSVSPAPSCKALDLSSKPSKRAAGSKMETGG